jgi:hypothetical protein
VSVLNGAVELIVIVSSPGPRSIVVATPPAVESTRKVSFAGPSATVSDSTVE